MAVGDLMGLITHKAPELPEGYVWLNTAKPLSLSKLAGHIVILDFWTYCCINCMHMLPILSEIEKRYSRYPVVVIGVHSAKFRNENNPDNIREAVSRYGIGHPVIVDNDMRIWGNYGASAWPTLVIIGPTGRVEFKTAGELSLEQLDQLVSGVLRKAEADGTLAKKRLNIIKPKTKRVGILSYPGKLSFSADGTRFALSDSNHNRILIINRGSGKIVESIGIGIEGLKDGGFGDSMFFRPQGVLWLGDLVYVADTENHAVRVIDLKKRSVGTVAGTGKRGPYLEYGHRYSADTTPLNSPWDLASDGKRLFIAMAGLHQIWEYSMAKGTIAPFAGAGSEGITDDSLERAEFAQPSGMWIDGDNLYVADSEASGVRSISISKRFVATLVGDGLFVFGDQVGRLQETLLQHPIGISGNRGVLYVADTYNGSVKGIDLNSKRSFNVISGSGGKAMCRLDDPGCDTLGLFEPNDVKIFGGILYIVDTNNHLVRYFDLNEMLLKTLKISE